MSPLKNLACLCLACLFLSIISGHSQTTLAAGDVSIVGISANPTKGFAFVPWVALAPGTQIIFSENGFNDGTKLSSATGNVRWRKPYGIWENTTGATIAAGTVITLVGETESHGTYEIYTVTGSTSASVHTLSNSAGGHLFVMQGGTLPTVGNDNATVNSTVISAIGYQSTSGSSSWLAPPATMATSPNSSLPTNLALSNTLFLASNANVGQYSGARTGQATLSAYKALVTTIGNWSTGAAAASVTYTTTAFTANVMPLRLLSFTGVEEVSGTNLQWKTTEEFNVASYHIERSSDGTGYTRIGNVAAKNSSGDQLYQFTDLPVSFPTAFYRLKMEDIDGSFTYSPVVVVRKKEPVTGGYALYPNPVTGHTITITSKAIQQEDVLVRIVDVQGKLWQTQKLTAAELNNRNATVSTQGLPAGAYFLEMHGTRSAMKSVLRFQKQ